MAEAHACSCRDVMCTVPNCTVKLNGIKLVTPKRVSGKNGHAGAHTQEHDTLKQTCFLQTYMHAHVKKKGNKKLKTLVGINEGTIGGEKDQEKNTHLTFDI